MEHLILLVDTWVLHTFPHANHNILSASGHIVALLVTVALLVLVWYIFLFPLQYIIKIFLYKRRHKNSIYKMLYFRLSKIVKPPRYLVSIFLLEKTAIIFSLNNKTTSFVFFLMFLFVVLWWIFEIVKFILYGYLSMSADKNRKVRRELFNLLLNITKIILTIVAVLIILSKAGVNVSGLITSLGVGGIVLGLSAKDTLTNFFDSIRLVGESAFNLGDWIETSDAEGLVTEIGLVATKIRTFENALVTIPNSRLVNSSIKNWSKRLIGRQIKFDLRLKYTYDTKEISKVVEKIRAMIEAHDGTVTPKNINYLIKTKQTYKDSLFDAKDTLGVRSSLLVFLSEIDKYSMNILIYTFSVSVVWEDWLTIRQDVIMKTIDIIRESSLELAIPAEQIILEQDDSQE